MDLETRQRLIEDALKRASEQLETHRLNLLLVEAQILVLRKEHAALGGS